MRPILRVAASAGLLGLTLTAAADYRLTLPKHGLSGPAHAPGPALLGFAPGAVDFGAIVVGQSGAAAQSATAPAVVVVPPGRTPPSLACLC